LKGLNEIEIKIERIEKMKNKNATQHINLPSIFNQSSINLSSIYFQSPINLPSIYFQSPINLWKRKNEL